MRPTIALAVALVVSVALARASSAQEIVLTGPDVFLKGTRFTVTVSAPSALQPVPFVLRLGDGTVVADTTIDPLGTVTLHDVIVENASQVPLQAEAGGGIVTLARPVLPGLVSVLPPIVAIVLALVLREVLVSLFAGIWLGCLFLVGYNPIKAVFMAGGDVARGEVANADNASIILFTLLIGGMVGVVTRMGGMRAIVEALSPMATTRVRGQLVTWAAGLAVFFDDYANTLIVGSTMRPLTDRLRISREKLAYIVDSTAAPVATLAISTWIGYQLGLINDGLDAAAQQSGNPALAAALASTSAFDVFFQAIPYMFYPILALVAVLVIASTGRDFGPMLAAERRAASGGGLLRPGARPAADISADLHESDSAPQGRWWNGIVPVAVLVVSVIIGLVVTGWREVPAADRDVPFLTLVRTIFGKSDPFTPLIWGASLASITAIVLATAQRILPLADAMRAWIDGLRAMLMAMVILVLAWSLGEVTTTLEAPAYLASILTDTLPPALLPVSVFVVSALMAFATGTSWTTMAILLPLVVPLSVALVGGFGVEAVGTQQAVVVGAIGSVLAGAIMGDHCSPISDTTVLSSTASGCDHVDHVRTQLPYALMVGVVAIVLGSIPSAFGVPAWVCLVLGAAAVWSVIRFYGIRVEEAASGEEQLVA